MFLHFCAERELDTKSDSQEKAVFNRILKANKGNDSKATSISCVFQFLFSPTAFDSKCPDISPVYYT